MAEKNGKTKVKIQKAPTTETNTTVTGEKVVSKILKGKGIGSWHYYAPRKETVMHDVSCPDILEKILALLHEGKFWKVRVWTKTGIHSAKTFAGRASLEKPEVKKVVKKIKKVVKETPAEVPVVTTA